MNLGAVWESVAEGLKGNTEALLAFALALMGLAAVAIAGVNPWLGFGFPALLYVLYIGRAERRDRHDRRIAEAEIRKLELSRGAPLTKGRMLAELGRSENASVPHSDKGTQ
jgi:hypothetical protein